MYVTISTTYFPTIPPIYASAETITYFKLGDKIKFRDFENAPTKIKELYALQHRKQTVEFNRKMRQDFTTKTRARLTVWDALRRLETITDESDPDLSYNQLQHSLQTAERLRAAGKPDWLQVVGLIHDLGKILLTMGSEGQWDVVGDTFVVGCAFSDCIIFPHSLQENPDINHPDYADRYGIYEDAYCGLEKIMMSWGHDEYLYLVLDRAVTQGRCSLPPRALDIIRYNSFYSWHSQGAYEHLMSDDDHLTRQQVREFVTFDLYTKGAAFCDIEQLKSYYQGLLAKFFTGELDW